MRIIGFFVLIPALLAFGGWFAAQPAVRAEPESGVAHATYPAVPTDSVRLLPFWGGEGCTPFTVLARLHVRGRLFSPSDEAVHRALRHAAGRVGANAVAFTTPSMDDLPVLGLVDRFWSDTDDEGFLQHNEKQVGRAVALRCQARRR
jgi:hypothetical protein